MTKRAKGKRMKWKEVKVMLSDEGKKREEGVTFFWPLSLPYCRCMFLFNNCSLAKASQQICV